MKKVFKFTAFLIMIISLFTLSASAKSKTIEWDFYGDNSFNLTYNYGGKLNLGNNKIAPVNNANWFDLDNFFEDYVYYEFDVEKSGYYSIEILGDLYYTHYIPSISQDIRDNVVHGEKEYLLLNEDYSVYLEEGDCIFGVDFFIYEPYYPDGDYNGELKIEYIAEEMTDIRIEDEYLEDIILGYHINPEFDENNTIYIPAKGKVVFNNGKEFEFDQYLDIEYSDDIEPGENKITFILENFKKEYTVQIKTVDDYIENIEIGNIKEVAVVTQTFIPDLIFSPDVYLDLIVTKPDGTKIIEEEVYYLYDIELKGDKSLSIWFEYIQGDNGKWYFIAYTGDKEYLRVPCETVPASFENNYFLFVEKVTDCILFMLSDFSWYMHDSFSIFSGLSITERLESFADAFASIGNYYSELYELTKMFIACI